MDGGRLNHGDVMGEVGKNRRNKAWSEGNHYFTGEVQEFGKPPESS
jgi:hypothetical protein